MVWAKLDDAILDNPKIAKAGVLGFAMHVAGITYCCRNVLCNTADGFVPDSVARRLLDVHGILGEALSYVECPPGMVDKVSDAAFDLPPVTGTAVADWLVECKLWVRVEGGYIIHDYEKYNPTRAEAEAERAWRSAAGKAGARKRWPGNGKSNGISHGTSDAISHSIPVAFTCPVPVPVPEEREGVTAAMPLLTLVPVPAEPKRKRHRYPETFAVDPKGDAGAWAAWCMQWRLDPADARVRRMANTAVGKGTVWRDWHKAYENWAERDQVTGVRPTPELSEVEKAELRKQARVKDG